MSMRVTAGLAAGALIGAMATLIVASPGKGVVAASPHAAEKDGVIAIANDSGTGSQLLYLIDAQQQVFSVYEFDPKRSKLKLAAARRYAVDHQLQEYNTESPTVADIEKLVPKR